MKRPIEASRNGHRWIIAIVLAVALITFVAALSLAQVSSAGAGKRIMARTTAAMTEIDSAMPQIVVSLQKAADQSGVDPIPVPDFPVPVAVPRDVVIAADVEQLRDEILSQSANRMYDDGVSVWDDTDLDASQNISRSSAAGGMRAALSLIGDTPRTIFLALTVIAAIASAPLAIALAIQATPLRGLRALGAVLAAVGITVALGVLIARVLTNSAGDDPFGDALADIAIDAQGVGLRNSLVISALGLTLLTVGTMGALVEHRENGPNGLSSGTDE